MTVPRLIVLPDARRAAQRLAEDAVRFLRTRDRAETHIAVSGGSLARLAVPALLDGLAAEAERGGEGRRLNVWFADERFVPADHPERNELAVRSALPDGAPSALRLHPAPPSDAGLGLEAAAAAYAQRLASLVPAGPSGLPRLDLVLLGAGPDGHTASLFPGRPEVLDAEALALPVRDSPKPPPERITLGAGVLRAANGAWVLAGGAEKAPALALGLSGASATDSPVGSILAEDTRWYLDEAADAALPRSR